MKLSLIALACCSLLAMSPAVFGEGNSNAPPTACRSGSSNTLDSLATYPGVDLGKKPLLLPEGVTIGTTQASTSASLTPGPISYLAAWDFSGKKAVALGAYTFYSKPIGSGLIGLSGGAIVCAGSSIGGGGSVGGVGGGLDWQLGNITVSGGMIIGVFAGDPPHLIGFLGFKGNL